MRSCRGPDKVFKPGDVPLFYAVLVLGNNGQLEKVRKSFLIEVCYGNYFWGCVYLGVEPTSPTGSEFAIDCNL